MDNASFIFGVDFQAIRSIVSHANTSLFARFTRMYVSISWRAWNLHIFNFNLMHLEGAVHQVTLLTNGQNYFRVLLSVPLLPRQFRRQVLRSCC